MAAARSAVAHAVVAAWRLRRWRQRDSATSAVAAARQRDVGGSLAAARRRRQRQWRWRQREARRRCTARRQQRGCSRADAAAVVAARQHDVGGSLAAARWQWQSQRLWRQRDVGGGGSAPARRRRQHGGGTPHGAACGDVHRSRRCVPAAADNTDGDADDIVC